MCVKWVPFVKLAFSLGNRAHFGSKNALFCSIWTHHGRQKKGFLSSKMRRFWVKTPIWQMAPVSRAHVPPPPRKSVNFEDFLLICTVSPHFWPFVGGGGGYAWRGGGGVKPNFADKNFMDTWKKRRMRRGQRSIRENGVETKAWKSKKTKASAPQPQGSVIF